MPLTYEVVGQQHQMMCYYYCLLVAFVELFKGVKGILIKLLCIIFSSNLRGGGPPNPAGGGGADFMEIKINL